MAEMRLTLQLSGIQNLTTSIGKLNGAISTLNSILNRTAAGITAVANSLNKASGTLPKGSPIKNPGGGGSGGSGGGAGNQSPQDAYSLLFSIFSGAPKNVGAKLGTNMLRALNVPTAALMKFAVVAGLVYFAGAMLYKGFMALNDMVNRLQESFWKIYGATAGNTDYIREATNIAEMFNMDRDKVAADIQGRPGGYQQFISELKAMTKMSAEGRRQFANARGLQDYQSIDKISNFEGGLNRPQNTTSNKETSFWNRRVNTFWAQAVKPLQEAFLNLAVAVKGLAGVYLYARTIVMRFSLWLGDLIAKLREKMWGGNDKLKESAKDLKGAAKDLKDAAFTAKEGIYGGGDRARGAIPAAWTWNQSMMMNNARNLGAFEY